MRLRHLLPVALLLALGACNMAVSDHPMFSAEPKSAFKFKNGLWAAPEDADCKVDTNLPAIQWPECGNWLMIADNQVVDGPKAKPNEVPVALVIADGEPPILEFPLKDEGEKEAKSYAYVALEPVSSDTSGAVIDLRIWLVACGTEKVPGSASQIDPYPGFDKECHPLTTSALRAAAIASRPKTDKLGHLKWVRATAN